jgi:hypothetical protein
MGFSKLAILAPMAVLVCATSIKQKHAEYSDPRGRFSLNPPGGWTMTQLNEDAVHFSQGNAYVTVMVFPGGMDPTAAIENVALQAGKQWGGFSQAGKGHVSVGGQPGVYAVFSGNNPRGIPSFLVLTAAGRADHTFFLMMSVPQAEYERAKVAFDQFQQGLKIAAPEPAPAPALGDVPRGGNGPYRNPLTGEVVSLPAGRRCYVNQQGEYYVVTRPGDDPNVSAGGRWVQLTPVNGGDMPANVIDSDPGPGADEPGAAYRVLDDRNEPFTSRPSQPRTAPAANRTGRTGNILLFRTAATEDQSGLFAGPAYTFLAPANWNVQSGIVWRSIPSSPSTSWVRMSDPATGAEIGILPEVTFTWGDFLARYFRQGSLYEGNEMQPLVTDPFQVARQFVIPRLRPQLARARVVEQRPLPELADALCGRYSAGSAAGRGCSAGRIRFEYEEGGRQWEEDLYISLGWAVLNVGTVGPGTQVVVWSPHEVRYSKAEKGKLNDQIRLFQMVNHSYRPTLQFYNRRQQLISVLVNSEMARGDAAARSSMNSARRNPVMELSGYIARTNDSVSSGIRSAYQNRQEVTSRAAYSYDRAIRGVDEWQNPHTGEIVPLPTGYNNGWVNNQGQFATGMSPGDDPNVTLGGNWTPMTRYPR